MRRFLQLATVFLVAVVAAGSPLATVGAPHAIPAVAAAAQVVAPQCTAVTSIVSTPSSLICVLPRCDGPYCRASNGCWVCCTH
jgi:hypothetical protein